MSQLVGNGHHSVQITLKVGQHPALLLIGEIPAEGAAALPRPGIEVDPVLPEGPVHHLAQIGGEGAQQLHQVGPRPLGVEALPALPQAGAQLVPGKALFIAEHPGLPAEIGVEFGEGVLHRAPQRLEGFRLHAALGHGHGHHVAVAPQLGHQVHVLLDAVEGEGHPPLDALGAGELRLEGGLAQGLVRAVDEAPELGQRVFFSVHGRVCEGGKVAPQVGPGAARAALHPAQELLGGGIQHVPALFRLLADEEAVVRQDGVGGIVRLGEDEPSHPAAHQSGLPRHAAEQLFQPPHGAHRLAVPGIGLPAHVGELLQVGAYHPHRFLPAQQVGQRRRVQAVQAPDLLPVCLHHPVQAGNVRLKGRVVKSVVQGAQIPAPLVCFHAVLALLTAPGSGS